MIEPFERAPIGTTEVTVTRLGLGAGPLGGWPTAVAHDVAQATVQRAWDVGVRYFDTAPFYGYGLSEQHLGRALAAHERDAFTLSTKVGRLLKPGLERDPLFKGTADLHAEFDFSAAGIQESLAASRDRLGLERIDIVHIHDPDDFHAEALQTAYPLLADLRADGVIGAVGAGMIHTEPLQQFAEEADFDCFLLAGRYTLLEQNSLPLLATALERRISIIAGGVFNSGLLISPGAESMYDYEPAPAEVVRRAQRIHDVCKRFGVPLRAAAIQFPLAHPAVASVIVGARSPEEVDDNLKMIQLGLPPELWTTLKEDGLLHPDAPTPSSR